MPSVQHARGTKFALDALAAGNSLLPGQIYVITDENRIAVALTVSTYETFAKESEAGGGGGVPVGGTTGQVLAKASATDYDTAWVDQSGGGGDAGVTLLAQETITTSVNAIDIILPADYSRFRIILQDVNTTGTYSIFRFQVGGSFVSTGYKIHAVATAFGSTSSTTTNTTNDAGASIAQNFNTDINGVFDILSTSEISAVYGQLIGAAFGSFNRQSSQACLETATKPTAIRLTFFSGSNTYNSGIVSLYGYKETL